MKDSILINAGLGFVGFSRRKKSKGSVFAAVVLTLIIAVFLLALRY